MKECTVFEIKSSNIGLEHAAHGFSFFNRNPRSYKTCESESTIIEYDSTIETRRAIKVQTDERYNSKYIVLSPEVEGIIGFTLDAHQKLLISNNDNYIKTVKQSNKISNLEDNLVEFEYNISNLEDNVVKLKSALKFSRMLNVGLAIAVISGITYMGIS